MLKKLVKYGNSSALVLDKALLELLNIAEGSLVKIKTDGTSLIITPHNKDVQEKVSPTILPNEVLSEAVQNNFIQSSEDPTQSKMFIDEIHAIEERYKEAYKKLYNPEYQQAYKELAKKFEGSFGDPEFSRLNYELTCKFMPEYAQMQRELQEVNAKYPSLTKPQIEDKDTWEKLGVQAKKVHEKYAHLRPEILKLQENPDYINDLVMLSEKYQITKNSPEYIKEYLKLIAKYIPEYAQYQEELHALGLGLKQVSE